MSRFLCVLAVLSLAGCASDTRKADGSAPFSFREIQDALPALIIQPACARASDGTMLAYYVYKATSPRAALLFLHGGGAYSGAGYQIMAKSLAEKLGVSVLLVDIRGHGNSGGARGDSPAASQVFHDVKAVVDLAKTEWPGIPLYLGGHSSGAGLVLNYSTWKDDPAVAGYVFLSPYLGFRSGTERKNNGNGFSKAQTLKFVLNGMTFGLLFGHSKAVFFNYPEETLKAEPLLISAITVNMSLALTPSSPKEQFTKLSKPFCLLVGKDDELLDPTEVMRFAQLPDGGATRGSSKAIIEGANHLSVITVADSLIGEFVSGLAKGTF